MTECEHEWGEWEKILWYTPKGRFVGEARRCSKCSAVEILNIEMDLRPAVLQPTIGVFAGIFNKEGKLLLKKITNEKFVGEWDLPGGGVDAQNALEATDERIIGKELARHVMEEVGISLSISPMPPMYPAVLKGGGDLAFVIPIMGFPKPTKGETKFVSLQELRELAEGSKGNRLLSGWGKRMCRLCLRIFQYSLNTEYSKEAYMMLLKIQKGIK